jgi:hypothetical protein
MGNRRSWCGAGVEGLPSLVGANVCHLLDAGLFSRQFTRRGDFAQTQPGRPLGTLVGSSVGSVSRRCLFPRTCETLQLASTSAYRRPPAHACTSDASRCTDRVCSFPATAQSPHSDSMTPRVRTRLIGPRLSRRATRRDGLVQRMLPPAPCLCHDLRLFVTTPTASFSRYCRRMDPPRHRTPRMSSSIDRPPSA